MTVAGHGLVYHRQMISLLPRLVRATALLAASALLACGDDGGMSTGQSDLAAPADLTPPDRTPLPPARAATATALHYDVAFDVPTRASRTAVSLRIEAPGNCVTLGFRAGEASEVTFDGQPAQAEDTVVDAQKGTLTACRGGHATWTTGEKTVLAASTTVPKTVVGQSQVGYSVKNDSNGKPFSYLVSWVNGCDHHGLCDAAASRFATYTSTVTSDAGD